VVAAGCPVPSACSAKVLLPDCAPRGGPVI
jgi:hypothetical protein